MARVTGIDILDAFKDSVKEHYDTNMTNTEALKAEVVQVSSFVKDRFTAIRETFNNSQAGNNMAHNGNLFKSIFKSLEMGSAKAADDDGGEVFTSSGSQDDNSDTIETTAPRYSADTMSRNKTSYDVAGIQVKALVTQTTAIVTSLSDQTSYLKNMDSNLKKIYDSLQAGFRSQEAQNVEAAKQNKFYSEQGYLNIAEYMKHVKEQSATTMQMLSSITNMFKDPKQFMTTMFGMAGDKLGIGKMFEGIDTAIAKGFTRVVDKVTDSPLLKGNDIISKTLRQILTPQEDMKVDGILNGASGITKTAKAQFDNVTHRTINDIMPGLLERILGQTEITAQILSQSTGVKGVASGTTYNMETGKFSTAAAIRDSISKNSMQVRNDVAIPVNGTINLSQFENVLRPIIHYMATYDIKIKNFYNMNKRQLFELLLHGLGVSELKPTEPLAQEFEAFYAVFRPQTPGSDKRTPAQDKAIREITTYYNNMKQAISEDIGKLNAAVSEGRLRSDTLGDYDQYGHTEVAHGKAIPTVSSSARPIDPTTGKKLGGSATSDSFADIGQDIGQEIVTAFKSPFESFKKLADHATTPGSIYVHDTVAIQYLKALKMSLAPGKKYNGVDIGKAWDTHKRSLAGVSGDVGSASEPEHREKAHSPNADTSYADEDLSGGVPGTTGVAKIDEIIGKVKYQGMKFASDAGYKGFDKNLNSDQYKDQRSQEKSAGWAEKSMHNSDYKRVLSDLDTALSEGKISRDRYEELVATLNNSSPEEYKTSLLKSLAQWSPVILGGLVGGPFGALAGLGIRNIMKRNTSDRVSKALGKDTRDSRKNRRAQSKYEKERADAEAALQQAREEGKITFEEYEDGIKELSTSSAEEYKGGLMKWAKKLGPAVLGGFIGGPLGFLVGAVVGKKLIETTASKVKKRVSKAKPRADIWDGEKRKKLIDDINVKIEEMKKSYAEAPTQEEKDEIDEKIKELEGYKQKIIRAGQDKLLWYMTSVPGILAALGNIRHLPRMIFQGLGKLAKVGAKKARSLAKRGFNAAKRGIKNVLTRMFIGDPALGDPQQYAQMHLDLQNKLDNSEITIEEFSDAYAALEDAKEKFDANKGKMSGITKIFGGIGKGIKGVGKFVGAAAGMVTGKTQKGWVAEGNQAAAEAQKMLRGDETEKQKLDRLMAEQAARTADATEGMFKSSQENSLNTADSQTHSLLRQLIHAVDPNADISGADRIDRKHSKESPDTLTAGQVEGPKAVVSDKSEQKRLENGQPVNDSTDERVMQSTAQALMTASEDDLDEFGELGDSIADTADDNSIRAKVKRMFDMKERSLKRRQKDKGNSGDGDKKEETLLDKLMGGLSGIFGGKGTFLTGLTSIISKVPGLIAAGLGAWWALKGGEKALDAYNKPIDEEIETRQETIDNENRHQNVSRRTASQLLLEATSKNADTVSRFTKNTQAGIKAIRTVGQKAGGALSSLNKAVTSSKAIQAIAKSKPGQMISGAATRLGNSRLGTMAKNATAGAKDFMGGIRDGRFMSQQAKKGVMSLGDGNTSAAGKAGQKFFKMIDDFVGMLKNNKFVQGIGNFFRNAFGKAGNTKFGAAMKKIFTPANLKKLARAFGIAAIVLAALFEGLATAVRYLEDRGTNIQAKIAEANEDVGFPGTLINQIMIIRQVAAEEFEKGGEGFEEVLAKAFASVGLNMLATAFIPGYGIIKLALIVASMILELLTDGETDHNSIMFFTLRSLRFFIDDLLALDENLIDSVANVLVEFLETIGSLFSGSLTKVIEQLKSLRDSFVQLVTGILKHAAMILVDLLLIAFVAIPILYPITLVFIKTGGGDMLLQLRQKISLCLAGQMSFGDLCQEVLSSAWSKIKGTLENVGAFFSDMGSSIASGAQAAGSAIVSGAQDFGNWVSGGWNKLMGNGKGRGRRFGRGELGGDLYQEGSMYQNAPFDMFGSGCGPIALAAALRNQGVNASPMGAAAALNPYRGADGGTDPRGILDIGNRLGGRFTSGSTSTSNIANAARQGRSVVMMGQNGPFGDGMHYMTAQGMEGDNVVVRDPLDPNLRHIPKSQLSGVSSAIYGQGRGGRTGGRGFAEALQAIKGITSGLSKLFGGIFGDPFGSQDGAASSGPEGGYSEDYEGTVPSGEGRPGSYIDAQPKQAEGDCLSVNGKIVYPKEMCKDPGGNFPYDGNGKYGPMLPTIKDLLIAQYKYNLILPSVIACIMRGETSFGQTAHEKNLGNIMDHEKGSGTKAATNMITDAQLGHRYNYEAYNYWGESIYRIGHFLANSSRYVGAVKNTDTLSSLQMIAAGGYAEAANWGNRLYGYWSDEHMGILNQYDKEAIDALKADNPDMSPTPMPSPGSMPTPTPMPSSGQRPQVTGMGRGGRTGGRGFAEAIAEVNKVMDGLKGMFGDLFGSPGQAGDSPDEGAGISSGLTGTDTNNAMQSGGTVHGEAPLGSPLEGSFAAKVMEGLRKGKPNTKVNLGWHQTWGSYYTASNPHRGIDFGSGDGAFKGTKVYSPVSGEVIGREGHYTREGVVGNKEGGYYGNHIKIKDSAGRMHLFGHLSPNSVTGQNTINEGDYLGLTGNTGSSSGAHLHYEVRANPTQYTSDVDPNATTGKGRSAMFAPKATRSPLPPGIGGFPEYIDYTDKLSMIYDILLQIAQNTGASLKMFDKFGLNKPESTTGFGRGPSQKRYAHPQPQPDRLHHKAYGLGAGYQVMARGY